MKRGYRTVSLGIALACLAGPALADRIDGDWCSPDGTGHFRIEADRIETVTGRATRGDYGRHTFTYVVPEGDSGAGDEVLMQQLSEEAVRVRFGVAEPEVWLRCKPVS